MKTHSRQALHFTLITLFVLLAAGFVTSPRVVIGQGTPTPTVQPAKLPFTEDFADANNPNQWWVGSDKNGTVVIDKNALTMTTKKASYGQWVFPPYLSFPSDVDVSVTAQAANPDKNTDWDYGIGVRGRNVGSSQGFYCPDVVGDGTWSFFVHPDAGSDSTKTLTSGKLKDFNPDAAATLRIVAQGNHFDLYINDTKVGETADSTLPAVDDNQILLYAGTGKTTPETVEFTHATVDVPGGGTETASSSNPLFSDNFADSTNPNNWGLVADEVGTIVIADGALTIETKQAQQNQWTYPDVNFPSDVDASAVGQAVDPDKNEDWYFGIGVRGRQVDKSKGFYYFQIDGFGNWEFGVHPKANTWTKIKTGVLANFSPDAATTLRIVAIGSHFDLYLNDSKVGQADDSSLETVDANRVILLAGTYVKTTRQLVKFTDMSVAAP